MTLLDEQLESTPPGAALTETVADFLRRIGDISPERVRMHPAPGTATEADVEAIHAHEKRLFELVEGVLVEKGMGYYESLLAIFISTALHNWVMPRHLGVVSGESGMMRLFGRDVRIPDVAYASWERLGGKIPREPVPELVPDIAVEVLSKSNTKREMERKRGEYLKSGVRLVWEVDGKVKTVTVFEGAEKSRVLKVGEILDGGEVLPGFTLLLAELFRELER